MTSARVLPASYNTHTYGDATRDYQVGEMSVWESDHTIDLAIADKGEVLDCYDDAASFDESAITVAGATNTSATRFRLIRSPAGQRHDGTPNNGFTISNSTAVSIITLSESYAQIHDLIGFLSFNTSDVSFCFKALEAGCKIVGCIAKCVNAGSGLARGFSVGGPYTPGSMAINCLAFECKSYGFFIFAPTTRTHYLYNCTSINSGLGFRMEQGATAGTVVLTNCLGSDNASGDFTSDGAVTETVTYCLSKDATADDWSGAGNLTSKTLTFRNAGGDDWHLASSDTDAINAGADLSATFDDDIDFTVRSSWDIGFDEYEVIPGPIDSLTLSEASSNVLSSVIQEVSDSLQITDSPSSVLLSGVTQSGSDTLSLTDVPSITISSVKISASDNLTLSDSPSSVILSTVLISALDTLSTEDVPSSVLLSTVIQTTSDILSFSEVTTLHKISYIPISETLTLTEVFGSSNLKIGTVKISVSETLTVSEATVVNKIIDSYPEAYQNTYVALSGSTTRVGQSFTGTGMPLDNAQFSIYKRGSPTGNAYAVLYAHSGTFGTSSIPTGPALATSDAIDVTTFDAVYRLRTFHFSVPYTPVNGTKYVIALQFTGGTSPSNLRVGIDTTSPTHPGNYSSYTGTTWTPTSTYDLIFYALSVPSGLSFVATETLSISEQVIIPIRFRIIEDLSISESVPILKAGTIQSSASDDISISEVTVHAVSGFVSIIASDTVSLSEASSAILSGAKVIFSDSLTLSEALTQILSDLSVSTSDTISISENAYGLGDVNLILIEGFNLSENIPFPKFGTILKSVSDALSFSENASRVIEQADIGPIFQDREGGPSFEDRTGPVWRKILAGSVVATETLTLTEVLTRINSVAVVASDNLTLSENSSTTSGTIIQSTSDILSLSEVTATLFYSGLGIPVETFSISEYAKVVPGTVLVSASTNLSFSESDAKVLSVAKIVTELLTISEQVYRVAPLIIVASDTVSFAERIESRQYPVVSEDLSLSEVTELSLSIPITVQESLTVSEDTAQILGNVNVTATENFFVSEEFVYQIITNPLDVNIVPTEYLALTLVPSIKLGDINVSTQDAVTLSENAIPLLDIVISVQELFSISEATDIKGIIYISTGETLTLSEVTDIIAFNLINLTIAETLTLAEILLSPGVMTGVIESLFSRGAGGGAGMSLPTGSYENIDQKRRENVSIPSPYKKAA